MHLLDSGAMDFKLNMKVKLQRNTGGTLGIPRRGQHARPPFIVAHPFRVNISAPWRQTLRRDSWGSVARDGLGALGVLEGLLKPGRSGGSPASHCFVEWFPC